VGAFDESRALERAMPADAVPGSTIPEDTDAEVQLRDGGGWVWAQVIGQRQDRHGRWCIGLRWYASPSIGGREGWYLYDPQFIRRPVLRSRAALLWRGCHSGRQWLGCGKTMIAKLLVAVPEAFVAVMVTG
jgi:hypothetical protein